MKTIINIQKTENRNIKNFSMKTFAVLTTLAMFSFIFTTNASNSNLTGTENDNLPSHTAMHVVAPSAEAVSSPVMLTEAAAEASLEVESWMTNESFFAPLAVAETEQPMGVEEWMINNENFKEITYTEENDQFLEVENWMLDKENFTTFTITKEADKALKVESWMLDENIWGK